MEARDAAPDVNALIEPWMDDALRALDGRAPHLAGMVRYHLGDADVDLTPLPPGAVDKGKRMRPAIALLCAGAAGGDPAVAAPLGAALELLHNFTLIHDDIQDHSPTRRHRETVWHIWGIGQGINAGDALFAAAHLPLFRLPELGVPSDMALRLVRDFDRMTIAIVEGQTLDIGFEGRNDVTPADYLGMISGKTAAIVRFAARSGAILGGADDQAATHFEAFGEALGIGFQVQDDLLGIWGTTAQTGKAPADDIRRRKQSLPILLLRDHAAPREREELSALFAVDDVDARGVARVLDLLDLYDVRGMVESQVRQYHDAARTHLLLAAPDDSPCRHALLGLVERLTDRQK